MEVFFDSSVGIARPSSVNPTRWCPSSFTGHATGTGWLEVPTICKAYFSILNFRDYPHNIWPNIWYSTSILGSWIFHWIYVIWCNWYVNVEPSKYHQIPSIWIEEKIPGTVADEPRDAVATNEGPRRDTSQKVEQSVEGKTFGRDAGRLGPTPWWFICDLFMIFMIYIDL
jgi:hypothetical protein